MKTIPRNLVVTSLFFTSLGAAIPFVSKPKSTLHTVHSLLGGFVDASLPCRSSSSTLSVAPAVSVEPNVQTAETASVDDKYQDSTTESAHLKLNSPAMMERVDDKSKDHLASSETDTMATLHTYHDEAANVTICGLNVSKRKFKAWLQHTLETDYTPSLRYKDALLKTNTSVPIDDLDVRLELRELWRRGLLLSDRTEVLAVYKSETNNKNASSTNSPGKKRGSFPDLLEIYADRLSAIIQDELTDHEIAEGQALVLNTTEAPVSPDALDVLVNGGLLGWLEREYGKEETRQLCFESMQDLKLSDQYAIFQHFLEWFRSRFPYYYDRCDSCGASAKDDAAAEQQEDDEDDNGSFLGYIYPNAKELLGKASRTEVYQCTKCGAFTRFPRYNAASSVIRNGRGRCGEYSMLLYRILRATGHSCRWIVDWADHVWAEVQLHNSWIHLDPCEAAVDKPLLYEEWGKQQTYIVAFHAPPNNTTTTAKVPLIEDVTLRYTSDDLEKVRNRRDESHEELVVCMERTIAELERKLAQIQR